MFKITILMNTPNLVLLALSIIVPIWFMFKNDITNRKSYSLREIVSFYPLFVIIYILARLFIAYDYYFVNFWANTMADYANNPKLLILISQTIVFIIDSTCWYFYSRSSLNRNNSRIASMIIFTLSEAALLMLVGMVIPWVANVILELIT